VPVLRWKAIRKLHQRASSIPKNPITGPPLPAGRCCTEEAGAGIATSERQKFRKGAQEHQVMTRKFLKELEESKAAP
jgi:hypothetical protein